MYLSFLFESSVDRQIPACYARDEQNDAGVDVGLCLYIYVTLTKIYTLELRFPLLYSYILRRHVPSLRASSCMEYLKMERKCFFETQGSTHPVRLRHFPRAKPLMLESYEIFFVNPPKTKL